MFSPFTWIVIILLWALLSKNAKTTKVLLCIVVFFILIFTNSYIIGEVLRRWEKPMINKARIAVAYNAGIVLGGGMVTYDKAIDRLIFRKNTDRIIQTIDLYKSKKIEKIIISGGYGDLEKNQQPEAVLLRKYLIKVGIPEEDIFVDSLSSNTHENAVNTEQIITSTSLKGRFLLITSAIHMKRAVACFVKEGVKVDVYPTNKLVGARKNEWHSYLKPTFQNMMLWDEYLHEWVGYQMYKLMGYL